jgi:hypothetical protein
MSKKIIIPLDNRRSWLHDLFHEYLDELYELEKNSYDEYDEEVLWAMQNGFIFPGCEDFWGEDFSDVVYPPSKHHEKGNKRDDDKVYEDFWNQLEKHEKRKHRKSKGKGAKVVDITKPYSGFDGNDDDDVEYSNYEELDDDNGIFDGKEIYFYPIYTDKSSRIEFTTLNAFSEFCADNGYSVSAEVGSKIAYNRRMHTCLNPSSREEGIFEIMAEESYATLLYEAIPVKELSQ